MNSNSRKTTPQEFYNSVKALAYLDAQLQGTPVDEAFLKKVTAWEHKLFRLVVIGEIKKGKTSFINALLGKENLLPVSSDIATSTIYKICYGEKLAYKVFFHEKSGKPPITIQPEEIAAYGTETGNPENEKEVDFIQVFVPSPVLKSGLVIIDTPGLGGFYKEHKFITYKYIPQADAVFMVSDSVESPIGQAELNFLKDIRAITKQVYFVQTKAMAVGAEERQIREKNNRNILITKGEIPEEDLRYFVVDSHLKYAADENHDQEDLEDSGFVKLTDCINTELIPSIQPHLMKKSFDFMLPKLQSVITQINQMGKICDADSKAKQDEIAQEFENVEEAWADLEEKLPDLEDDLNAGLQQIQCKAMDFLKYCKPNGEMHREFEQIITNSGDLAEVISLVYDIREKLPAAMAEYHHHACTIVQTEVTSLLASLSRFCINQNTDIVLRDQYLPVCSQVQMNSGSLDRTITQALSRCTFFEEFRNDMFGAMAGGSAGAVAGAAIGSVIPVIGTAVGAGVGYVIGSFWGSFKASSIKEQQDLNVAKNMAVSAINTAISSAYSDLSESIKRFIKETSSDTVKAVKKAIRERKKELQKSQKELKKRQTMSLQAITEERRKINGLRLQLAEIQKNLNIF